MTSKVKTTSTSIIIAAHLVLAALLAAFAVVALNPSSSAASERTHPTLVAGLAIAALAIGVSAALTTQVRRGIERLLQGIATLTTAAREGLLDERPDVERLPPELRPVLKGIEEMFQAFVVPLRLNRENVEKFAHGITPRRIEADLRGEFAAIKTGWNDLIGMVERRNADVEFLYRAAVEGRLEVRADTSGYEGYNGKMLEKINAILDALVTPLRVAAACVDCIAKGDIPEKISAECKGEFDILKHNLNVCIESVNRLVADTTALSSAAVSGNFDFRADPAQHTGDFRRVVQGVNDTIESIVVPFRVMTDYCERISHGEIPPRRTKAVQGDVVAMQASLNRCVDALGALVADVEALAQRALEGQLSARIDLARHEGAFHTALEGVNHTLDTNLAPIQEAIGVLQRLAKRDLRPRMAGAYKGDHVQMKDLVNAMASALHDALAQVAQSVDQVSSAATQIAASSQSVASGASEQASALQETTASFESISSATKQSAENAQQANRLAQTARAAAGDGSTAVEEMLGAMIRIKSSAEGTSQIIRDINDIAFQTNLLALNAAVEAARAGEAGRGFAVVAEEVRSLALRAKEAAAKTEELISQSVKEAAGGEVTAKHVVGRLSEIATDVSKVTDIVGEIAAAAREQAAGIEQVTHAVAEMDKVIQLNAASAEESSSAASELSGQAEELASMVAGFQLATGQARSGSMSRRQPPTVRGRPGGGPSRVKAAGDGALEVARCANGAEQISTAEGVFPMDETDTMRDF